jgi:Sortase domain
MELTTRRRRAISTALALVLALESVTVVAAAAHTSVNPQGRHALPEASPAGLVLSESSADAPATVATVQAVADIPRAVEPASRADEVRGVPTVVPEVGAVPALAASLSARAAMPERTARGATASPAAPAASAASAASAAYKGRNHVWIPALGISRSVSQFPCDRARPPDNLVYRWGCAGANNIYLMGHAYSVFKPLHDAYAAGRLAVGMKAWYADSKGKVHVYVVRWWKTTRPTTGASWAWAAQGKPSMTLQTCVGSNGQYRLMVRLVEVNG